MRAKDKRGDTEGTQKAMRREEMQQGNTEKRRQPEESRHGLETMKIIAKEQGDSARKYSKERRDLLRRDKTAIRDDLVERRRHREERRNREENRH